MSVTARGLMATSPRWRLEREILPDADGNYFYLEDGAPVEFHMVDGRADRLTVSGGRAERGGYTGKRVR